MQTRTFACVVAKLRAYGRLYQMTVLLATSLGAPPTHAASADNTLPMDGWRARVPSLSTPPAALAVTLGIYPSAAEAFVHLDSWATSHGPSQDPAGRKFSTGLVEAPPGATVEFTPDGDNDGETDAHLYAEPVSEFGAFPRNCSRGDGALFRTGGHIAPTNVLVYEPAEGIERSEGPLLKGLCTRVYCQGVSGCGKQGDVNWFNRRAVLPFMAKYEANSQICDSDRRPVFEDLLGRASSGQSCKVVGGLNDGANLGGDCPPLANGSNPVNSVTGNKYQREQDYAGTVHRELRFVRHYNSLLTDHRDVGLGWRHSYSASLTVIIARNGDQSARLTRADGRVLVFNRAAGRTQFTTDPLTVGTFQALNGGASYEYTDGEDVRERYALPVSDSVSRGTVKHLLLESLYDPRSGRRESLHYDSKRLLAEVQGRFGRHLRLVHDGHGRLRELTDPAGRRYSYDYDRLGRLRSVTYPDLDDDIDVPLSRANNPLRAYRYEDGDWPKGLTHIVDESGQVYAHWDYDTRGRALLSEHAGGVQRVRFDYQAAYTAITDAHGQTRSYNTHIEYGVGLVTAVSGGNCNFCGAGALAATSYDINGQRNLVTDHLGNLTDFDYDANGLELRKSEGSGAEQRITTSTWRPDLRLLESRTLSNAAGQLLRRASYQYWGGMLKQRSEEELLAGGATAVTTYHYFGEDDPRDPRYGLLKSVNGPRTELADVAHYDYDVASGNLLKVTDALGHVTRYTAHNADGRVLAMLDINGVETRYAYDARGRIVSHSVAGAETRIAYDQRGLMVAATFPDESSQTYRYDDAQRLVRIEDAAGNAIDYTLDALGNRSEERHLDRQGKVVARLTRLYNRHNQLEQLIGGAGQTTGYRYDANGRLQTVIDARGGGLSSSREYDSLGRGVGFVDNLGGVTRIVYDSNDQALSVTDPRGLHTRYRRDGFGRLLGTDSPDAGVSKDDYDSAGNRIRHTYQQKPGLDIAIGYKYDALNRLTMIDYPTDTDVIYGYDEGEAARHGLGRLTSMRDASGATSFDYDARGNVRRRALVTAAGSYNVGYAYDLADRVTRIDYPSGVVVEFTRDAAGRVSSVNARAGATTIPLAQDIEYHPLGGLASLRFASGLVETRSYDEAGRLAAILSSDHRLPSYRYSKYDAADNLLRVDAGFVDKGVLKGDVRNYRYDALERLTFEDSTLLGLARSYRYDANGNRIDYQHTDLAGRLLRRDVLNVEPQSNRVHGALTRVDDYDAAGNMTRLVAAASTDPLTAATAYFDFRIAYTEGGRLKRTTLGPATAVMESSYNGFGQRTVRATLTQGRRPTVFVHGESGEVLSAVAVAPDGRKSYEEYVWINGRPLAQLQVSAGQMTPRVNYIHVNQVNQAQYMTGSARNLSWAWRAGDAFGAGAVTVKDPDGDGVQENPVIGGGFPGQIIDGPFFNNGFRDYDARTGRYVQSDPIGFEGGINTYTYATNNPARFIDPFGLDATRWLNSDGGRNAFLDGPSNGNWGGKCLSGGMHSCGGKPGGDAPPTDSADRCYKYHDKCYDECGEFPDPKCIAACDARLVEELEELPNDPRAWGTPPRTGTEGDSRRYRDDAIELFRRRLGTQ